MIARFSPPDQLSTYAGFIFDCDGTLADTMTAHFTAWRSALAEGGSNFEFTWDLFVSRAGMSMERTVAELADQFGVKLNADHIAQRQRELFHDLSVVMEPVAEVLSFAREVAPRFPVSVASGSSRVTVERTLVNIGARDLFDVIVTPEDVEFGKPHPDMFLLAAEKMGVPAEKCLVIEDGELGFEAARRAKMDYLVVASPAPAL